MGDLEEYFRSNPGRLINKWDHYFEIYEHHFAPFRGRPISLLEIGVSNGGSLEMWRHYFGPDAAIVGVDIDPRCKEFEGDGITVEIGSQQDREFLAVLAARYGPFDVVIDDGGHTMRQQIVSLETLFGHVKVGGFYLCEDTHTSYSLHYGGGFRRRGTFIEYAKALVDDVNAFHSKQRSLQPSTFTTSIGGIHFYDGVVVLDRVERTRPVSLMTGARTLPVVEPSQPSRLLLRVNVVLRKLRLPTLGIGR